jgi:hypothetical protein
MLVCRTQGQCLDGELGVAQPNTLRYRSWRTAGRLVHHGAQLVCVYNAPGPDAGAGGDVRTAASLPARC